MEGAGVEPASAPGALGGRGDCPVQCEGGIPSLWPPDGRHDPRRRAEINHIVVLGQFKSLEFRVQNIASAEFRG